MANEGVAEKRQHAVKMVRPATPVGKTIIAAVNTLDTTVMMERTGCKSVHCEALMTPVERRTCLSAVPCKTERQGLKAHLHVCLALRTALCEMCSLDVSNLIQQRVLIGESVSYKVNSDVLKEKCGIKKKKNILT